MVIRHIHSIQRRIPHENDMFLSLASLSLSLNIFLKIWVSYLLYANFLCHYEYFSFVFLLFSSFSIKIIFLTVFEQFIFALLNCLMTISIVINFWKIIVHLASVITLERKVSWLVRKSGYTWSCEGRVSWIPTAVGKRYPDCPEVRLYLKLGCGGRWSSCKMWQSCSSVTTAELCLSP